MARLPCVCSTELTSAQVASSLMLHVDHSKLHKRRNPVVGGEIFVIAASDWHSPVREVVRLLLHVCHCLGRVDWPLNLHRIILLSPLEMCFTAVMNCKEFHRAL